MCPIANDYPNAQPIAQLFNDDPQFSLQPATAGPDSLTVVCVTAHHLMASLGNEVKHGS